MNEKHEEELCLKYRQFFSDAKINRPEWAPHETPIGDYGIECGDGWHRIIANLCEDLETVDPPASFRFAQIKEKFGCYDELTDVLSEGGWKRFAELLPSDKLATLSPPGKIEFHEPSEVMSYRYDGEMIHFAGRGVDLMVTPNHQMYVSKATYYDGKVSPPTKIDKDFEFNPAIDCIGWRKRFAKGGEWAGCHVSEIHVPPYTRKDSVSPRSRKPYSRKYQYETGPFPADEFLEFLGFYVAEGCSDKHAVSIAFNNVDGGCELNYLRKLIESLGLEHSLCSMDKSAGVARIYSSPLARYLKHECGHLAPNKMAPGFVGGLPPEQIVKFLNGLYAGDGHTAKSGTKILSTTSRRLADDVQVLLLKAGFTSRISCRDRTCEEPKVYDSVGRAIKQRNAEYSVSWIRQSNYYNQPMRGKGDVQRSFRERTVMYRGMVYCATVPHHTLFVRRNGIPVWCGNSLRVYTDSWTKDTERLIGEAEEMSATTCEDCGSRLKVECRSDEGCRWIRTLCATCRDRSESMRKKKSEG